MLTKRQIDLYDASHRLCARYMLLEDLMADYLRYETVPYITLDIIKTHMDLILDEIRDIKKELASLEEVE